MVRNALVKPKAKGRAMSKTVGVLVAVFLGGVFIASGIL
jgi:hypothetical protein